MLYLGKHLPGNTSDSEVNGKHAAPSGIHCLEAINYGAFTTNIRACREIRIETCTGELCVCVCVWVSWGLYVSVCACLSLCFPYLNGSKLVGGFIKRKRLMKVAEVF